MAIETITVIGAGPLGRAIACDAASGAYKTILEDISRTTLEQALAWIEQALRERGNEGESDALARDAALARLSTSVTVEEAVREGDLIIETVPEEMEMKIELFTIFDKFAKPQAILATSAGSLSITEMAAITFCPERCVAMRFSDTASGVGRLELVRGAKTSEETVRLCSVVGRRMGKQVVTIDDGERGNAVHNLRVASAQG